MDPVVVKDHAHTAHQAINEAVGKLKRAITTAVDKHESHRRTGLGKDLQADAADDLS